MRLGIAGYRELKRRYDLDGPRATVSHLTEAIQEKHLAVSDFSLKDLAEALVPDGREWVRSLDPRLGGGTAVLEASDAVDVTAFANITGQLIISKILEGYQSAAFVFSGLIPNIPTRLDGEKIPGVTGITDQTEGVHPGMPFPHLGFGEDYIETPSTTKRGFIVPVTKEAIFFDRTNLVMQRASEVGEVLGVNKEKRLADLVIGATNNYKWKGTEYDTYQATSPWINVKSSNELVDWTNVDAAEQLFADMLDPHTGEPVNLGGTTLVASPAYGHAVNRILNATEIRYNNGGNTTTIAANPLRGFNGMTSKHMYRRLIAAGVSASNAAKYWFLGDFAKAFAYMENWPITVVQAPANSEAEFTQDIVLRYKASERGAAAVINPRYVVKNTG